MKSNKILNGMKNWILCNLIERMLEQSEIQRLVLCLKIKKFFLFLSKLITIPIKLKHCTVIVSKTKC